MSARLGRSGVPVTLLVCLALLPSAAQASFSSVPDNTWVTDGRVDAVAVSGNHVFLGGAFSRVGPNTGSGVALDPSTGVRDQSFDKVNGTVDATLPDGSGGFYVAGAFSRVGSAARSGVVHLFSNGSVDPGFTANADGEVLALARIGGRLYLGGAFYSVNGVGRTHIAAVDSSTGVVTGFQANASQVVRALALSANRLFVGGDNFMTINGAGPAGSFHAVDPVSGTLDSSFTDTGDSSVYALLAAGSELYIGGGMRITAGGTHADDLVAIDPSSGAIDTSLASGGTGNGTVYALAASATRVYAGGNLYLNNRTTIHGVAAFNLSDNSTVQSFTPNPDQPVHALTVSGNTLYVGGEFTQIAGGAGGRVRALDATSGALIPAFDPDPNAQVNAVAVSGSRVFVGGSFVIVGGVQRSNLAALNTATGALDPGFTANANSEVRALALRGSQLYLGGSFSAVNGIGEGRVASVDATNGVVAPSFHADTTSGTDVVTSLVASSGRLYAGGMFSGIGGLVRSDAASLFLDTGAADPGFRADADQTGVNALALGDGHLFLAGGFAQINGDTTRRRFTAADPVSGNAVAGFAQPTLTGGTLDSLTTLPGKVYLGGSFSFVNGSTRSGGAAFDSSTGALDPWNPAPSGGGIAALAPAGSELAVGGDFPGLAGGLRPDLAAVDPTTAALDAGFNPGLDGKVRGLAGTSSEIYAGGDFLNTGIGLQPHFAAFGTSQPGAPVNATSPTITGTAQQGQTLAADPGTWTGNPTSYGYSWRLCDLNGFNCSDTGVTSSTYLLHAGDVAHTLIVRVTATNGNGTSSPVDSGHSPPVSASSSANAPSASTGGTTGVTATGATLDATVNPSGEDTTYHFDYGTDTSYGHSSPQYSAGAGSADVAVEGQLINLLPDTTYHYQVVAHNASGTTLGVDHQFKTSASSGGGATAPTAVTGAASSIAQSSATLSATVNPGGTETTYYFEYGADASYGHSSQLYSAGSGTADRAVDGQLVNLQPNTTYHYRVVAHNGAGTAPGLDASFKTAAIPPPANTDPPQITGTPQVDQTLTALHGSWNPTPTGYSYQWRSCDNAGSNCQDIASATKSQFKLTGDLAGKTVRVRVGATGDGGPGTPVDSDATSAVTPAGDNRPATVTVHAAFTPATDDGHFDLKVGSTVVKAAARNGDSGSGQVPPGAVTVSEAGASGSVPADYTIAVTCTRNGQTFASAAATSVDLSPNPNDQIDCTFQNTRLPYVVATAGPHATLSAQLDSSQACAPAACKVPAGHVVRLTVQPDSGYVFSGWTGECAGQNTSDGSGLCVIDNTSGNLAPGPHAAMVSVAAVHTVVLAVSGPGFVTYAVDRGPAVYSCSHGCSVVDGATLTITAHPNDGASIDQWNGDCANAAAATTCTLPNVTSDKSATLGFKGNHVVTFGRAPGEITAVVSPSSGGSCGSSSCQVSDDTTVILTAHPPPHQQVWHWTNGCQPAGSSVTCSLSGRSSTPQQTVVFFKDIIRTVTWNSNGHADFIHGVTTSGGHQASCPGNRLDTGSCEVVDGGSVTLTPAPPVHWEFNGWSGACLSFDKAACTLTGLTSDVVLYAYFTAVHTVSFGVDSGTGTVTGAVHGPPGFGHCGAHGMYSCTVSLSQTVMVTATPGSGEAFAGWNVGGACSGQGAVCDVGGTSDVAVRALFSTVVSTGPSTLPTTGTATSVGLDCVKTGGCTGTVAFVIPPGTPGKATDAAVKRSITIGTAHFNIKGKHRATVLVKLTPAGRRALVKRRKLQILEVISVKIGGRADVTTRRVSLVLRGH